MLSPLIFAGDIHGPCAGRAEAAGVERGDVSPDKLFTLPRGNNNVQALPPYLLSPTAKHDATVPRFSPKKSVAVHTSS
jgi:hypothetical protein